MKNRFLVINKEKIYAYVVSIMTVLVIFFMTNMINTDVDEVEEVTSNSVENSIIGEAISTNAGNFEEENDINKTESKNEINTEE